MSDFTVGGVFKQVLHLLRRHWLLLLLAALVLIALPMIVGGVAVLQLSRPMKPAWFIVPFGLSLIGGLLFQILAYRVLLIETDGVSPVSALQVGPLLRLFLPVLAILILAAIAGALAAALLVFPAVMLMCRWFLILPVGIVEESGVFESFRRSAALTKGARWKIFGILLLFSLIAFVIVFLLSVILHLVVGLAQLQPAQAAVVTDGVVRAVSQLPILLASAATYVELRRVKEGFLSSELVEAFA